MASSTTSTDIAAATLFSRYKADNELRASDGADSVDASRNGGTIFWSSANEATYVEPRATALRAHAGLVGDATR